ncbi:MAG: hypothetical protein NTX65_02765 [Ignavibacteriales bacterium]|nr:hypothetical protein [Ignavibacteriales bacterium]
MKIICDSLILASIITAQQKTIEQKVDSVLALMTLDEKVGQLNQLSSGVGLGTVIQQDKFELQKKLVREGKVFLIPFASENKSLCNKFIYNYHFV